MARSVCWHFPSSRNGIIRIEFRQLADSSYSLLISDDGIGLPTDLNLNRIRTLELIRGLSKQLGGALQIDQHKGVQISLTFAEEKVGQESLASL